MSTIPPRIQSHGFGQAGEYLALLEASIGHLNDLIVITKAAEAYKPRTEIVYVNDACERLTGYTREEFLGKTHWMLFGPNTDLGEVERLGRALAKFESVQLELIFYRKDGCERWFDIQILPVLDQSGTVTHWVSIERDITDRVNSEKEKQALESQLREAQKMEAIGTLAGGIAHDFNNILGVIIGNAELAELDAGQESAANVSLHEIKRAAMRAKGLIQQILTFSRRQPQELAVLDLAPMIEEGLGMMRSILPSGISISSALGTMRTMAKVDSTQVSQILLNLCTNASHAMQGRTGAIKVELEEVVICGDAISKPQNLAPGKYARLRVADNGCGIPPESIDRIFEPFFTTKSVGQGTGLGLSVVHGIVKDHGGAIEVRSQVGVGTTFEVYLPTVSGVDKSKPMDMVPHAAGDRGQHVLYVDDEESMVFIMRRLLERRGFQVSAFEHPTDALDAFRANPDTFDVIVTDQNMPGASGLDVARIVKGIRPNLPVAIISGYVSDDLVRQANQIGVTNLLHKPNSAQELCNSIAYLIAAK